MTLSNHNKLWPIIKLFNSIEIIHKIIHDTVLTSYSFRPNGCFRSFQIKKITGDTRLEKGELLNDKIIGCIILAISRRRCNNSKHRLYDNLMRETI